MSLGILVAMVVVGLALAIGAVRLAGLSHPARLANAGQAAAAFNADYPDERVASATLADNGRVAYLELDGGGVALVVCMGARTLSRLLTPQSVTAIRRREASIELALADFSLPGLTAAFDAEADAIAVEKILSGRMRENIHA